MNNYKLNGRMVGENMMMMIEFIKYIFLLSINNSLIKINNGTITSKYTFSSSFKYAS